MELVAGGVELGLELGHAPPGGLDGGRLHLELGLRLVVDLIRDQLVVPHSAGAVEGEPRAFEIGLRTLELGLGRRHRRRRLPLPGLVALRLDPGEDLALLDGVAFSNAELDDAARDVGADVDVAPGADLP